MPLPAGGDHEAVIHTYAPGVIVRDGVLEHRHGPTVHMHPKLAMLMSTSGSTGSPKLVRLSQANLCANAESIAQYLDIGKPTGRQRLCRCHTATACLSSTVTYSVVPGSS